MDHLSSHRRLVFLRQEVLRVATNLVIRDVKHWKVKIEVPAAIAIVVYICSTLATVALGVLSQRVKHGYALV